MTLDDMIYNCCFLEDYETIYTVLEEDEEYVKSKSIFNRDRPQKADEFKEEYKEILDDFKKLGGEPVTKKSWKLTVGLFMKTVSLCTLALSVLAIITPGWHVKAKALITAIASFIVLTVWPKLAKSGQMDMIRTVKNDVKKMIIKLEALAAKDKANRKDYQKNIERLKTLLKKIEYVEKGIPFGASGKEMEEDELETQDDSYSENGSFVSSDDGALTEICESINTALFLEDYETFYALIEDADENRRTSVFDRSRDNGYDEYKFENELEEVRKDLKEVVDSVKDENISISKVKKSWKVAVGSFLHFCSIIGLVLSASAAFMLNYRKKWISIVTAYVSALCGQVFSALERSGKREQLKPFKDDVIKMKSKLEELLKKEKNKEAKKVLKKNIERLEILLKRIEYIEKGIEKGVSGRTMEDWEQESEYGGDYR